MADGTQSVAGARPRARGRRGGVVVGGVATRRGGPAALALALALVAGGSAAGRAAGPTPALAPAIAGTAAAGRTLTAASGTWAGAGPIAYAYHWYRCDAAGAHCVSARGLAAPSYALRARDVGKTIGLTITATDASGSAVAYASLVGPIAPARPLLVSTAQPQVTGVAIEGKALQVTTGAWSPAPDAVTYSWERCNANGRICAPIPGASASSYLVTAADVGHALLAVVHARFGTASQDALSTATAPALGGDAVGPTHTALPAVAGTLVEGAQLVARPGIWAGVGSLAYGYQWYRCDASGAGCSSIHGATASTYTTVAADVGRTIGLTVRASDATGVAVAYASLAGPIAARDAPLVAAAQPALAGSPRPGATLTVAGGAWLPAGAPPRLAYGWRRCNANGRVCVPIPGAAGASYVVRAADVGHALLAVVTAASGAARQPVFSAATPPVS